MKNKKLDYIDDERSVWKYLIFDILTLGIYSYWLIFTVSRDINKICKGSEVRFQKFWKYVLLNIITLGIYSIFWWLKIIDVIRAEGRRRSINTKSSAGLFIACYLLRYICGLAVLVAFSDMFADLNKLAAAYNREVRTMPKEYFENPQDIVN